MPMFVISPHVYAGVAVLGSCYPFEEFERIP